MRNSECGVEDKCGAPSPEFGVGPLRRNAESGADFSAPFDERCRLEVEPEAQFYLPRIRTR